ncbi:MAG: putative transport system ATP-binding protein [Frankiaceae bacterium]|nr:putative transport system ATP-binding protein [Frankiaceae bacterium]
MTRPDMSEVPAATVVDVHKSFLGGATAVPALVGVDASFARGAVTAIVGPSGSGKSTLLRLLACLDKPDSGAISVDGTDVTRASARGRREVRRTLVGYVFQQPSHNLLDYLTAEEQVALAVRIRGVSDPDAPSRLLGLLGLSERLDHKPSQLSGGEQQRLALACAVAGGPALLVADEPTAQLDHEAGQLVLEALLALRSEGTGIVVSSHDPVVMDAADHVLRVADGRIEENW